MIYYHHYFQMASVLAGIVFYAYVKRERMIVFFILCIIGLLIDLASGYMISAGYRSNYFIINIYPLLAAPLIFYGFYKQLNLSRRNALLYRIVTITACTWFVFDFLFIEGINNLNTYTILLFYFFNVIISCGMLFKMAMREDYFVFEMEPVFWISAGILIFSLGTLVALGMNKFILINHITIKKITLYRVIMPVLNVIMYSSFTYAFITCRLKKKSYLQSLS